MQALILPDGPPADIAAWRLGMATATLAWLPGAGETAHPAVRVAGWTAYLQGHRS